MGIDRRLERDARDDLDAGFLESVEFGRIVGEQTIRVQFSIRSMRAATP